MQRQGIYNKQTTANPNQNIRQANIPSAPRVEGAGYGLLRAVGNAGGEIVKLVARDYAREWQGRVDDAVLRTNAEFERWKTEYMQTRQGVDALTAQEDFANKYAELSQQTMAEFGNQRGNEIYKRGLERELAKYGLYAVKAGGAYQIQQNEAWEKSQWDVQLSSFQKIVEDNPLDPDMISMERDTLLRSWMAKNPGLDPGAMRDKIEAMTANGRMNALIANGDYESAERLLGITNTDGIKAENSANILQGLSAMERRRYAQMIANGRNRTDHRAKARQIAACAQNVMKMAARLEDEQMESAILEETENIVDEASRDEIRRIAFLDLQWLRQKRKVDNENLAKRLAKSGADEMPSRFLTGLYSSDADEACRQQAMAIYLQKNGFPQNDQEQGRGQIGRGPI